VTETANPKEDLPMAAEPAPEERQEVQKPASSQPKTSRTKSTLKVPTLNSLLQNREQPKTEGAKEAPAVAANQPYTFEQLKGVWLAFAEQRKKYRAEYQLLTQEIELNESSVILHLHNPVQETLLDGLKGDLMQFVREKLNNFSIQITGELKYNDNKKVIYTNREKFEHLAEKNPYLKELRDRLGLDSDF
jgi:hypothetical protein